MFYQGIFDFLGEAWPSSRSFKDNPVKRKTTKTDAHNIVDDAERTLGASTLQAMGHLVVLWNAIEAELDATLVYATNLPQDLWTSIRSRISGLEAKADILKESLDLVLWFNAEERRLLADTLGDFMTLKGYRDSLVHVRLFRMYGVKRRKGILAFAPEKRGARYELLFSKELILAVNRRLRLFQCEMHALNKLVSMRTFSIGADKINATFGFDPHQTRVIIERITRADWKSLRANRKRRLALAPLPEFPAEVPIPQSEMDTLQARRRRTFEDQVASARTSKMRIPRQQ